jgi:hypothetical protein
MKYHRTNKFIFSYLYEMDDRSWMYRSGDVLANFKGVCAFFETAVEHASRPKEETIYCHSKVCKNAVMFKIVWLSMNTWFRVVSWIITLSGLSTMRHNQGHKAS